MDMRNMSIAFASGMEDFTEYNSSFDRGVLKVCYVGHNRNNSFISKDTFERCMKSVYNCPIVCRYDRENDEIGAHDVDLVKDPDGGMRLVNVTQPVGVIPESARYYWREVEEDDGSIHEYLFVDALVWKRQEAYRKIKEDGVTDESMEITVKSGRMVDGVYVIEDFEFTAFCLLGTAEPCFESASLAMFSKEDFKEQLAEMMREFKETVVQPSGKEDEIQKQNHSKGGNEALDEKKNLMAEYGLTEDMLDFSLEDVELDALKEKFEKIIADRKAAEQERFALAEQFRSELCAALSEEKIETSFGEISRYWYMDYDDEVKEVYCWDCEDWNLYGFSYSMNGDHVVIDFESKKRKKFAVVDFDEGEQIVAGSFSLFVKAVEEKFSASEEAWHQKERDADEKFAALNEECSKLRSFKENAESAADAAAREDIFSRFEDLFGNEAFEVLRKDNAAYSLEALEDKCYALRGRTQSAKFALNTPKNPKLPIEKKTDPTAEPYGGLFVELGTAGN